MKDERVYPHRCQYLLRWLDIEEIQSVMGSGVDEEVKDLARDLNDVEEFKGLKCHVSHLEGKGLMPKALKVVLTGPVALFSGVDDLFTKNFTDFTYNEVNMRDVDKKKYGDVAWVNSEGRGGCIFYGGWVGCGVGLDVACFYFVLSYFILLWFALLFFVIISFIVCYFILSYVMLS